MKWRPGKNPLFNTQPLIMGQIQYRVVEYTDEGRVDKIHCANRSGLKEMAIERGLERGFNGKTISKMHKKDFKDFLMDKPSKQPKPQKKKVVKEKKEKKVPKTTELECQICL
ncbi:iap, partial [Lasius niger]